MGILTSRFPASDLLILAEEKVKLPKVRAAGEGNMHKGSSFQPELNLLGKTVDEELMEIVKHCQYIAIEAGAPSVMSYVKITYKPEGEKLTIERKTAKHHQA